MSDYLFGKHHERLDNFLVKHFDRPTREERYENRMHTVEVGVPIVLSAASFMVGTGRVRAGATVTAAGGRQIVQAAKPLSGGLFGRWYRTIGIEATKAVPKILEGAEQMGRGYQMQRQGRILQGAGIFGWATDKVLSRGG